MRQRTQAKRRHYRIPHLPLGKPYGLPLYRTSPSWIIDIILNYFTGKLADCIAYLPAYK